MEETSRNDENSVDEAIRMFPSEHELPLYEMAIGDRPFDIGEFDLAVERMVEEFICELTEEDIQRIRGDESEFDEKAVAETTAKWSEDWFYQPLIDTWGEAIDGFNTVGRHDEFDPQLRVRVTVEVKEAESDE